MKRRIVCLLLVLLLAGSFLVSASASQLPRVMDNGSLLSNEERQSLEETARTLSDTYQMDIVILTESSLSDTPIHQYADDYYDGNGYGDDGILLLLAMEEREWYFSTCGDGIYVFTDYALAELETVILPHLSQGSYYDAFAAFLDSIPHYMDAWKEGEPVDGNAAAVSSGIRQETVYYESQSSPDLMLSAFIGLVTALVSLLVMGYFMNTKRPKRSAGDYLTDGSFQLYGQRDLFLYSNLTKTRRQENKNSAGGSSVHRSSSSRSHGGRGGKF